MTQAPKWVPRRFRFLRWGHPDPDPFSIAWVMLMISPMNLFRSSCWNVSGGLFQPRC
jgi:hypothetical protein